MKKALGITLLTLLCAGSLALAEDRGAGGAGAPRPRGHHGFDFEAIDANHDGKISKDELATDMKKRFEAHFTRMDANKDGVLDRDELKNGHGMGRGHRCHGGRGGHSPDAAHDAQHG